MELTNLLHDASFSLRKGNMPSRLVADELDLNLATLASTLLVIIVVVVGSRRSLSLDATAFLSAAAIATDGVRLVELGRGGLVRLICNVGHGVQVGEVSTSCITA